MNKRSEAMIWWKAISWASKASHTEVYYPGRMPDSLTGREIEKMYKLIIGN